MAWTVDSVGTTSTSGLVDRGKVWAKASETLTFTSTSSTAEDLTSSVIDFIPKGADFVVVANSGATNLSSDADLAVKASSSATGTFALLKDDLVTTMDAAMKVAFYDSSLNGEMPYYKLFVDSDGVQKATDTVTLEVYW